MSSHLVLIYASSAIINLIIGFFVLLQDRRSASNITFFGITFFQIVWIASLYLGYYYAFLEPPQPYRSEFFVQSAYASGLIALLILNMFFYYFPAKSIKIGPIRASLYLGIGFIFAFLTLTTNLVHKDQIFVDGIYTSDTFGPLYLPYLLVLLSSLLVSSIFATRKAIKLKGLEKRKIQYALVGCWIFVLTTILTNIVLPIFHIYNIASINLIRISPLYALFFIIPTFYSIYRYRFFNFSYVSLFFLRRLVLDSIFLFVGYMLYQVLSSLFHETNGMLLCGISFLFSYMFINAFSRHIPEFVNEGLRSVRKTVRELNAVIFSCDTLKKLQNSIEGAFLLNLNYVNAQLYVIRENEDNLDVHVYPWNRFARALASYRKDVLITDEIEFLKLNKAIKSTLKSNMKKLNADICLPLFSEKKLIGFFLLKRKGSYNTYSREEIDEILSIKRGLEISLMNILLKLNLEEENNLMKIIIDDKTKALQKKIQEINELVQQQSDFIAVTAHELRTPLSIATFQLSDLQSSKKLSRDVKEDLKVVDTSLINLKRLTDKLFAVQQYDLNKVELNLEKVDLHSFLQSLCKDFSSIMKHHNLDCSHTSGVKPNTYVRIDQSQFRQVLHNLLNNAAKFTPKGGNIVVEGKTEKSLVTIKISDSGEGIPDDLKKAIFEKFRTKKAGAGIGLGLYLCKKIVELHKGKIWVEDNDMGGASFCLSLKKLPR